MFQVKEYQGAGGHPLRYGQFVKSGEAVTGRAMWFVPGLGGSVKGALDFLNALLPHFDTIYGPDLRGFGLNPLETPLTSPKVLAQDLEAFYQQVIVPAGHADLTLCGISLGGVLSTLMAVEHPERYRRLVLLAPAYKAHPKSFSMKYVIKNTLGCLLQGPGYRTTLPYGVDALTTNEAVLTDPQYTETPPLELTAGFLLGVRSLTNQGFKAAGQIRIPTLVIIPGKDVVCDPSAMRAGFERIPVTTPKECREYPDFYHDVLMETGHSDVADAIIGWTERLTARPEQPVSPRP